MPSVSQRLAGKTTRLNAPPAARPGAASRPAGLLWIEPERIAPNPHQPRRHFDPAGLAGLAASIAEHGLLEPLLVRLTEGGVELVAGERRLRAAREAGLARVPARVVEGDPEVLALVENLHREDLGPLEEAEALARLREARGLGLRELAALAGKAESTVSEILSLAGLPAAIKEDLRREPRAVARRHLVEVARLHKRTDARMAEILYRKAKEHGLAPGGLRRPPRQAPDLDIDLEEPAVPPAAGAGLPPAMAAGPEPDPAANLDLFPPAPESPSSPAPGLPPAAIGPPVAAGGGRPPEPRPDPDREKDAVAAARLAERLAAQLGGLALAATSPGGRAWLATSLKLLAKSLDQAFHELKRLGLPPDGGRERRRRLLELVRSGLPEQVVRQRMGDGVRALGATEFARELKRALREEPGR